MAGARGEGRAVAAATVTRPGKRPPEPEPELELEEVTAGCASGTWWRGRAAHGGSGGPAPGSRAQECEEAGRRLFAGGGLVGRPRQGLPQCGWRSVDRSELARGAGIVSVASLAL